MLLARGASVEGMDNRGKTALAIAVETNHPEIADLLRRAGAR
jgi:ankyrin repeat protein